MVQWCHHFIMLSFIPIPGNWFQTNQPDNESDDRTLFLYVLPMTKMWCFSGKIWSTFVTVLWFSKTQNNRQDRDIGSCEMWFPKFTDNFGIVSSKIHSKPVQFLSHWNNVEKNGTFSCLTPVSIAMWCLHTLWRFTVPAYCYHKESEEIYLVNCRSLLKWLCTTCYWFYVVISSIVVQDRKSIIQKTWPGLRKKKCCLGC